MDWKKQLKSCIDCILYVNFKKFYAPLLLSLIGFLFKLQQNKDKKPEILCHIEFRSHCCFHAVQCTAYCSTLQCTAVHAVHEDNVQFYIIIMDSRQFCFQHYKQLPGPAGIIPDTANQELLNYFTKNLLFKVLFSNFKFQLNILLVFSTLKFLTTLNLYLPLESQESHAPSQTEICNQYFIFLNYLNIYKLFKTANIRMTLIVAILFLRAKNQLHSLKK